MFEVISRWVEWFVETKQTQDADYHFPALRGFASKVRFNPIRTMQVVAYGFARDSKKEDELKRLYDVWQGLAGTER